jgi:uncharacterized membrane protein YfcA
MTVAFVGLGALLAACVQSTTGLGFALILTPIVFALQSPMAAILIVTALGLGLNVLVLLGERRRPRVAWGEVAPILLSATPGAVCGLIVLRALPKPTLQVAVGVLVVLAALVGVRARRTQQADAESGSSSARLAIGFTTGALTTATGVSGPPLALWLARRGLAPGEVRDTLSAMFFAIGVIALLLLLPRDVHLNPLLLVAGLACVVAGHALGSRAFVRIEARRFEPLLLAVILCAGIGSVASGASAL